VVPGAPQVVLGAPKVVPGISKKDSSIATNYPGDDLAFVNHLKQYFILGVPGASFGKPGWLRFAYCTDEKIINASADSFKKAMEGW
jgi:aspartate aminotransferase